MAKIPVLNREDITEEIAPVYNTEKEIDGINWCIMKSSRTEIGYATLMFDLSGVSERAASIYRNSAERAWNY